MHALAFATGQSKTNLHRGNGGEKQTKNRNRAAADFSQTRKCFVRQQISVMHIKAVTCVRDCDDCELTPVQSPQ